MKQSQIPFYIDPDGFEDIGAEAKYPCSSQLMKYNAMLSRYYLTNEAIEFYGINLDMYMSDSPNKVEQFIEELSDDLYGVMARLAPFNYQYNCYLVAQSLSRQFPTRYAARKQFEKALVYQAQYKLKNIDVREINGIDLENNNNIYFKQLRKEFRHVSPKAMDILQSLGLLYNGSLPGKHLINYPEVM